MDAEDAEKVIEKLENRLKPNDTVVIAGKLDVKAFDIAQWINRISRRSARVFLDTEGEALIQGSKAKPYLIKPNEKEFAELTGVQPCDTNALIDEAKKYSAASGISVIALSLGDKGSAVIGEGQRLRISPLNVKVLSTVGAGDSMMAGLSFALSRGESLESAARLASACATAAVSCPGTQSPTIEEVNALINKIEIRII